MQDAFFQPVSGFDLPRFAGVPGFIRLPHVPSDHPRFAEVQSGLVGAPRDGGAISWQALQVARGLRGLAAGGADLVEVSPPLDAAGGTDWLGISLMYKTSCVTAERIARD